MQCVNCGAKINKGEKRCSFCGADIYAESLKEHQDIIDDINRKTHWWSILPYKLARKGIRIAIFSILAVIVLGFVGIGIARVAGGVRTNREYEEKQQMLAQFEELYEAGEFEEIALLYSENRDLCRGQAFERYYQIYYWDMYMGFANQELDYWIDGAKRYDSPEYLGQIRYFFLILRLCEECEEAEYRYEEEDAVEYYRNTVYGLFADKFGLSKEEVEHLYQMYLDSYTGTVDPGTEDIMEILEYVMDKLG